MDSAPLPARKAPESIEEANKLLDETLKSPKVRSRVKRALTKVHQHLSKSDVQKLREGAK